MDHNRPGRDVPTIAAGQYVDAFVPDPLPPQINYDSDLIIALSEANLRLGELSGAARQIPNPNLLIRPFMQKEAVLSSRIEGTEAEISDLYAYESRQPALPMGQRTADRSDVQEVANYTAALEYGLERLETLPISLRLIREIHARLMQDVRGRHRTPGEFRREQNWIGPPGSEIELARYVPPPVPEMTKCLFDLEEYLHAHDEHPPLVRLALIHYQFEAIHPFLDGNGRVGRLLVILLLVSWGLLPMPLLYLSAYFERHRQTYYDLLKGVSDEGDWARWLTFFVRGVAAQAREASALAIALIEMQTRWRLSVSEPGSSVVLSRLTDKLLETPILTIPDVAKTLDVTYPTARTAIDRLVELEILEIVPKSRPKTYVASKVFELLDDEWPVRPETANTGPEGTILLSPPTKETEA